VYGELYGGAYPHPSVFAVPDLIPVQRGVWYSPQLSFLAFDLLLVPAPTDDGDATAGSTEVTGPDAGGCCGH